MFACHYLAVLGKNRRLPPFQGWQSVLRCSAKRVGGGVVATWRASLRWLDQAIERSGLVINQIVAPTMLPIAPDHRMKTIARERAEDCARCAL
jgi:hypothetical protein